MDFEVSRLLELAGIEGDVIEEGESESPRIHVESESAPEVLSESTEDVVTESTLRDLIREEIRQILGEERAGHPNSSWLYKSMNRPSSSRPGSITRGFLGLGFK